MPDYSIALGVKPIQFESPVNQMAKMYELQNAQQSNQLNQMKMDEYQRGLTSNQEIKNYLANTSPDNPNYITGAYAIDPEFGMKLGKNISEIDKEQALAKKARFETMASQQDFDNQALRNLSFNTSNENVIAWGQDAYLKGYYTKEESDRTVAQILAIPVEQRKAFLAGQGAKASDLMAKPSNVTTLQNELATLSPTDPRRAALEAAIKKESEFAPVQPPAPSITEIVDPKDPTKLIRIDTRRYKGGSFGSEGVIGYSGKEPTAAAKENKIEAGKSQLQTMIDNMRSYYTTLNEANDIPSTERDAVSNVASWIQGSTVGQLGGRMVGTESQRARTNITNSKLALLNALKQATGKSAQELNSNQELKTNLDALSDVNQGYESAMDTLNNLEDIYIRGVKADKQSIMPKNEKMPAGKRNAKDEADYKAWLKSQQPKASTR
jgi:hypothetical protein